MNMLLTVALTATILSAPSALAGPGAANRGDVRVEIPLQGAFAPSRGYDDNDMVEVVLHGNLPNSCYRLAESAFERGNGHALRVRQFAIMSNLGRCFDKDAMPAHLKMAVPFTTVVRVGRLELGSYQIAYDAGEGAPRTRAFGVAHASALTVDDLPYAPVSTIATREYWSALQEVQVSLSGTLTSDCVELAPIVPFERLGDVFVVLPLVRPVSPAPAAALCELAYRPFQTTISLGRLAPGQYLIHVRSMAGNSVNKVIEVTR